MNNEPTCITIYINNIDVVYHCGGTTGQQPGNRSQRPWNNSNSVQSSRCIHKNGTQVSQNTTNRKKYIAVVAYDNTAGSLYINSNKEVTALTFVVPLQDKSQ